MGQSWGEELERKQEMWECSWGLWVGDLCLLQEEHPEHNPASGTQTMNVLSNSRESLICFPSSTRDGWQEAEGKECGDH